MEAGDLRARVEALRRALVTPEVVYFPVRHHSPACARQVRDWIRARRPRAVLIEAPEAYAPLIPLLADPECAPPVAIHAHLVGATEAGAGGGRAATYYPLCAHSPEWVALREGMAAGARVRFIDLSPAARAGDAEAAESPRVVSLFDEHAYRRSRLLAEVARRHHCRDAEEFWDHLVEASGWRRTPEELAGIVGAYCQLAREDTPREELEADGTLAREAAMARAIRDELRTAGPGEGPVLVVTGGFHSVVLPALVAAKPVAAPRGRPEGESRHCLVRYSLDRLDALSGYSAGMTHAGYYHALWEALERDDPAPADSVATAFLVGIGRDCREAGRPDAPSVADEIAALDQARRLARLRGHSGPSRMDVRDAIQGCLDRGGGERGAVAAAAARWFAGNATGRVPAAAGQPPLVRDFLLRAEAMRLPAEAAAPRALALSLHRSESHRRTSRFLHQLEFLEVPYATRGAGPDFVKRTDLERAVEHWVCQWQPQTEVALVEGSSLGSTVREASAARLAERAAALDASGAPVSAEGVALLVRACVMGLAGEAADLLPRLGGWVARDPSLAGVAAALSTLRGLLQAGGPLRVDRLPGLPELAAAAFTRACLLLDTAPGFPEEQAGEVLAACLAVRTCPPPARPGADDPLEPFWQTLRRRVDAPDTPPLLRGGMVGLLHAGGRLGDEEAWGLIRGALRPAVARGERHIAFLGGLLTTARELAWREPRLVGVLDELLSGWTEEEFLRGLPHLRLAWSGLTPGETDRVAALVAGRHGREFLDLRRPSALTEAESLDALRAFAAMEQSLAADGLSAWLAEAGEKGSPA